MSWCGVDRVIEMVVITRGLSTDESIDDGVMIHVEMGLTRRV